LPGCTSKSDTKTPNIGINEHERPEFAALRPLISHVLCRREKIFSRRGRNGHALLSVGLHMKRFLILWFLFLPSVEALAEMSAADKRIADQIIKTCREVYKRKRPCPCPYDVTSKDELCSTNSAYDKKSPSTFCERSDVKPEEIAAVKQMNESFITARCTPK
jgi:hypothetical protein